MTAAETATDQAATLLTGHQVIGSMPSGPDVAAQQCGCDGTWRSGVQHAAHLAAALARAADTRDRETLARVRALAEEWQAATCITDGAPCSFHRHAQGYADDLRAALTEPRPDEREAPRG